MNKEVLNIISESYERNRVGGPNKVIANTIKGLELLGYPYVINKDVHCYKMNWIHDSIKGFIEVTQAKIPSVIGPNIFTLPKDIPHFTPTYYNCIYLHPSDWCVDVWRKLNYKRSQICSWPVGIDTDEFGIMNHRLADNVMIYFKKRDTSLLISTTDLVKSMGLTPIIIEYGNYTEVEYKDALSKVAFGIWIGCSESQGIGLQEAMSTNLPLIVMDAGSLLETTQTEYLFPLSVKDLHATSVPYFDKRCGIIIHAFSELKPAIVRMQQELDSFSPRQYILDNLGLAEKAKQLIGFFELLENKHTVCMVSNCHDISNSFRLGWINKIYYFSYVGRRKLRTAIKLIIKRIKL